MLYSKDDIVTAVREELAEVNRECGISDGFTDDDYKYLGVIAAAWERLLIRQPNGSKPPVSGALPCSLCNGTGKQIPYHDVSRYYEDDGQ